MVERHQELTNDRRRRVPLRTYVAATASLLAVSVGSVPLLRRGQNNNAMRGRKLHDHDDGEHSMEGMTNWMDAQSPQPQLVATVTPILATLVPPHGDPVEEFVTTTATTATTTGSSLEQVEEIGDSSTPAPPHGDPIEEFVTATTTVAATTAAVEGPSPRQVLWYHVEDSAGVHSCVHNADYPDEYVDTSLQLLFETEIACCDAFDVVCFKEAFWYPAIAEGTKTCIYNAVYPDDYLNPASETNVYLFDSELQCCTAHDLCQPVVKPEKWYPFESDDGLSDGGVVDQCVFDNNYLDVYMDISDAVLFDSEEDCCTAYHCQTSSLVFEERWYPKEVDDTPTCAFGNDYNPEYATNIYYAAAFLFETQVECCNGFPVACLGMIWHLDADGTGCVFQEIEVDAEHVFISEVDCLAHIEAVGKEAEEEVTATTTATVAATTIVVTSTAAVDLCTNCIWHESHTQPNTCTNSFNYPISFENDRPYFFHHTADACCEEKFPEDCTIVDDGTPGSSSNAVNEFMVLGAEAITEDFENAELTIPFDLGTPPQWELTSSKTLSGSWSLRNLPPTGPLGTSDLVLRVRAPNFGRGYLLSCSVSIRISMPWDSFGLWVDGQQRNTYYQAFGGSDENYWFPLVTGFGPGEHTMIFRVKNGDVDMERSGMIRDSEFHGDGLVYLDDCSFMPQ